MGKKGNVAIITGASSGMGREFAIQIAQFYPSIQEFWIIARRKERLEELQEKLLGRRVKILALDLGRQEDIDALKQTLEEEKPHVRILVNAAGFGMIGKVGKMKEKDCTGMVDINCRALTAVTHIVLPYYEKGADHSDGILSSLYAAARLCSVCGKQVLCTQLFQSTWLRTEGKGYFRDSSLSGTGQNRIFRYRRNL